MEEGYLTIETSAEHPGLVRVRKAKTPPQEPEPGEQAGPQIRYIARFNDLSAAQMHVHARLRRGLVDIDTGLYRAGIITAVAAAESLALSHRKIYLDPDLTGNRDLVWTIAKRQRQHQLADRIWQTVGAAAIVLLLLKVLFGF